jgi:hypothetical protein
MLKATYSTDDLSWSRISAVHFIEHLRATEDVGNNTGQSAYVSMSRLASSTDTSHLRVIAVSWRFGREMEAPELPSQTVMKGLFSFPVLHCDYVWRRAMRPTCRRQIDVSQTGLIWMYMFAVSLNLAFTLTLRSPECCWSAVTGRNRWLKLGCIFSTRKCDILINNSDK